MFKKTVLPIVLIAAMLTLNAAVFAEPNKSVARKLDVTTFQLTKSLDGTKTFEKNQVISGKAEEGSEITMTIFWFSTDEDSSILSKKKSDENNSEGEWIQQEKYVWAVGASEIFAKPVSLNIGKNRIVISVKDKDGSVVQEVINVEVVPKDELTDYINNMILKNLK